MKQRLAGGAPRRIALPDAGTDVRVLQAAEQVRREGLALPVLIGVPNTIATLATQVEVNVSNFEIVDPNQVIEACAARYIDQRAGRETVERSVARGLAANPLYCGALILGAGEVDGMVAGANLTTAEVLRAAIRCVGLKPGIRTVSSFFAMGMPADSPVGEQTLLFADCAVVVEPSVDQLADIAISTAEVGSSLFDLTPRIAMLSFSTRGSAFDATVTKMREAARAVNERRPDLLCDGELQVDAALVPAVAERKAPGSSIGGQANILIFPDLDAANIGYKLVQRIGGATAIGPILQGTDKPVADLSRGCSMQDVVDAIYLTAAQAG